MDNSLEYNFLYDNTSAGNKALADLLSKGWYIKDMYVEDGHRIIKLIFYR